MCPTLHREDGFRFFIYSNEADEPAHVHVSRAGGYAKLWLEPVSVAWNRGFRPPELRQVVYIVQRDRAELLEAWNEHRTRR